MEKSQGLQLSAPPEEGVLAAMPELVFRQRPRPPGGLKNVQSELWAVREQVAKS